MWLSVSPTRSITAFRPSKSCRKEKSNMPARSFSEHFLNLPSNDDGNKSLSSFHQAFSLDAPHENCIKHVTGDEGSLFRASTARTPPN